MPKKIFENFFLVFLKLIGFGSNVLDVFIYMYFFIGLYISFFCFTYVRSPGYDQNCTLYKLHFSKKKKKEEKKKMSRRPVPPPTYEMNWKSAMDKIVQDPYNFSVKVMTNEGIWIEPRFHVVRDELHMNYHQPGNNIFAWATVCCDDADSCAVALRKCFTVVWGLSLCAGCKSALLQPGKGSCCNCKKFICMHFEDLHECVICKEPFEQVRQIRRLCGTCRQAICMSCWYDYAEISSTPGRCPHCKQQYHKLKRKRLANRSRIDDDDDDAPAAPAAASAAHAAAYDDDDVDDVDDVDNNED